MELNIIFNKDASKCLFSGMHDMVILAMTNELAMCFSSMILKRRQFHAKTDFCCGPKMCALPLNWLNSLHQTIAQRAIGSMLGYLP